MALAMKPLRAEDSGFKSNNLWVGSLTIETTDSDLTEMFGRYGDIDRITAYSSRGFAFIYYRHVEEAVAAKEALQGADLNGSQIKIEYARPAKPCKSLWVGGISPSVSKDDLEEEFSKFGKIEDFRFLRERKTAFIDYCEMDDALQAKSMNGKRMGGSYLRVDFLRSQAPRKEQWAGSYDNRNGNMNQKPQYPHSYEDGKGDVQPSKVLRVGYPPTLQIDEQVLHNAMILFGEIERIKSYPAMHFSLVEFRSVEEARRAKEELQGRLFRDQSITIMYSNDELPPQQDDTSFYSGVKRSRQEMFNNDPSYVPSPHSTGISGSMRPFRGSNERSYNGSEYNDVVGKEPNWRRPSPNGTGLLPSPTGPGILPSPAQGMRHPTRSNPGSWEGYDPAQLDRESKRTKRDGSVDGFTPMGVDERSYGRGSVAARPTRGRSDSDMWRGMISKGGTPVCYARCVPIGKGIETKLPEVINCSARTGLDMLAKHYTEAIGFEIVFFLPDSQVDFASFTEFLRYLGSKNRAGVAKLDDGTTLFLVPPSDFLTDVLKVSGPERLYGVVLKLPPPAVPVAASYRHETQFNPLPYTDQARDSPANGSHSLYHPRENYNNMDAPEHLTAPYKPSVSEPLRVPNNAAPQAGVSLTPELLATLASFLPATSQPTAPESHQHLSGTSTVVSTVPQSNGLYSGEAPSNQSFQQYGNQYTPAGKLPPPPPLRYPAASNNPNYSSGMVHGNVQYQGQSINMPQLSPLPNMPHNNYAMYTQGSSNQTVSQPMTQQYQPEASMPNQNYGLPSYQQANYHAVTTNQAHNLNPSQSQAAMQPPADKANFELQSQTSQLQPLLSGAGQGTTDGEVDKNQRYQSTLQFAANLLLQIQQKQQQQSSGTPAGQGP